MEELIKLKEENTNLKKANDLLVKEVVYLKGLKTTGKNKWIKAFIVVGSIMFIAGIFESVYSMFIIGMDEVKMSSFKIWFAAIGFIFVAANDMLGDFANSLGKKMMDKFFN